MDSVIPLYLVISSGRSASSDPQPMWFAGYRAARNELKRRLGVMKLHDSARGRRIRFPINFKQIRDGVSWEAEWVLDYATVTASYGDLNNSGRVCIYKMLPAGAGAEYCEASSQ